MPFIERKSTGIRKCKTVNKVFAKLFSMHAHGVKSKVALSIVMKLLYCLPSPVQYPRVALPQIRRLFREPRLFPHSPSSQPRSFKSTSRAVFSSSISITIVYITDDQYSQLIDPTLDETALQHDSIKAITHHNKATTPARHSVNLHKSYAFYA